MASSSGKSDAGYGKVIAIAVGSLVALGGLAVGGYYIYKSTTNPNNNPPGTPEVFFVGLNSAACTPTNPLQCGYQFTAAQAVGVATDFGGSVATASQLKDAQTQGAQWCAYGWTMDETTNKIDLVQLPWKDNAPTSSGCGGIECNGVPCIWTLNGPTLAGVHVYAVKPVASKVPSKYVVGPADDFHNVWFMRDATAPAPPSAKQLNARKYF